MLIVPLFAGCLGAGDHVEDEPGVLIRWTDYGIPHVKADDWYHLGLGAGFAAAEDNLCLIAEEYVTVNGDRSRYFGDGSYYLSSNGQTYTNLQSDVFWHVFDDEYITSSARWEDPRAQDLLRGHIEGYNRYVQDVPEGRHEACRDAPWLRTITMEDMERRVNKLQVLASSLFFAPYMVDASPLPGVADGVPPGILPDQDTMNMGSNGYAFGSDATGGSGLLLGNPHFPWTGPERFSQIHLTIPGELDIMGMTLMGVPGVLIGFNDHVAWTHTVSTAWRFTAYQLELVPGQPMRYMHDGAEVPLTMESVEIAHQDGTTSRHHIYFSHYGPIIEFPLAGAAGLPAPEPIGPEIGLTWTPQYAYTLRDANAHNDRIFEQFLAFNTATSFDDHVASLDQIHGIPWVNTIAASPDGRAFYADVSVTPNVPDGVWDACNTPVGVGLTEAARLPVLDGSTSDCDWRTDRADGVLPASEMPRVVTDTWVINSNDSHWLPNPDIRLEGFDRMIGWEESERSQRTRMGYVMIEERLAGDADCSIDARAPCRAMTMDRLQTMLFSSRLHAAEDVLDEVLDETCAVSAAMSSAGTVVDLQEACDVLAAWDRRADLESRGLAIFERFWLKVSPTWATSFDPERPVETPTGLVADDPRVRTALADAVSELRRAGIPLDVPGHSLRGVEHEGEWIPLHGARSELGSPSYMSFAWNNGWGDMVHGNSYIQTVTWDDGVHAEAILAYSQSTDPASPHFLDQTRLYGQKQWVHLPFAEQDVAAKTVRSLVMR